MLILIENNLEKERLYNLIEDSLNKGIVTIKGGMATGKTRLSVDFIKQNFSKQKVAIIEPFSEITDNLKNDLEFIYTYKPGELDINSMIERSIE